jgi:hypothetical protein
MLRLWRIFSPGKLMKALNLYLRLKANIYSYKKKSRKFKNEIRKVSEQHSKDSRSNYNVNAYKAELGTKIDKIFSKILNSGQIKMQHFKNRQSMLHKNEDSGFLNINENDMSRGAFEIGKHSYL